MMLRRVLFPLIVAPLLLAAKPQPALTDDPLNAILFGEKEPSDDVFSIALSEDGRTLKLEGDIELGAFRKFKRIFADAKSVKSIWLDSGGGLVLEAFLIASLVREAKLDTYVESNCASACTLIMASGVNRTAYARAKIGFHNSIDLDRNGDPVTGRAARKSNAEPDFMQAAAFYRAGIDSAFVDKALATPNSSIWEPTHKEMIAARALTRSIDDAERMKMTGWGLSWPALNAALERKPLWTLLKSTDAKLADDIVARSWQMGQKAEGGALGFAERSLLSSLFEPLVDGPPALAQRLLTLWKKAPSGSEKDPMCGASGTGETALADLAADGLSTDETALLKDALANQIAAPAQNRRKLQKALKAIYAAAKPSAAPEVQADPDHADCVWDRKALAFVAALPPDQQAESLLALHLDNLIE